MKTSHVIALVVVAALVAWFLSRAMKLGSQLQRSNVGGLRPVGNLSQLTSTALSAIVPAFDPVGLLAKQPSCPPGTVRERSGKGVAGTRCLPAT